VRAKSLLASAAIGTALNDLPERCRSPDSIAAAEPTAPPGEAPLALAFSGGGFRATLSAAGVVLFLADAGLLSRVRYVSSVSGGSVTNALLAHAYPKIAERGFSTTVVTEEFLTPLVKRLSAKSLKWKLVRGAWRTLGPMTRTDLLADAFDDWWLDEMELEALDRRVRWIFNAANVTTGARFAFERDVLGDYVIGQTSTKDSGLRVAEAVASSAAVPGIFAAKKITRVQFPCQKGRRVKLLDGGVYDNSGMGALDGLRDTCLIALNAGGLLHVGGYGRVPVLRDLRRAEALLYRQSTALRRTDIVLRFKAWEKARDEGTPPPEWARQGVLFGIATTLDPTAAWAAGRPERERSSDPENIGRVLADLPTSFDRFSFDDCRRLIYRGWWLTGATLSKYHPTLIPGPFPSFEPPTRDTIVHRVLRRVRRRLRS